MEERSYASSPGSRSILLMIGTLVFAFVIAIWPFRDAPSTRNPNPEGYGELGYTYSLALTGLPLAVLLVWLYRNRRRPCEWKAFLATGFLVFVVWGLLDVFFAHHLFCFPNPDATSGLNLPGFKPQENGCPPGDGLPLGWALNVPVEEFLFYLFAVLVVVLLYMWSSHVWFGKYESPDSRYTRKAAEEAFRALRPKPAVLILGAVLFLACFWYKKTIPEAAYREGFPWYALFLIAVVVLPNGLLYQAVGKLVNERALLFTIAASVLVSLLWEVTLARPHGWWAYQDAKTIGMRIGPWHNLPVEAAALWFAASWGNVTIYELFRLYFHSERSFRHLLMGCGKPVRSRWQPPHQPASP